MRIDTDSWKEFRIGDYFTINPTKAYKGLGVADLDDGGSTPFVVNSAVNNGIGGYSSLEPTEKGNIITFSDTTDGNTFFYQPKPFIGFAHVQGMHPINRVWNKYELLFLTTMLTFHNDGRFNYGRKMRRDTISEQKIKLPSDKNGNPDWELMEQYIKTLHHKPITTKVNITRTEIDTNQWKDFQVSDFFHVKYGINMELNACQITDKDDPDGVAFVARTAENNGISAYVKKEEGYEPQPAGTITVAGGGSVLSTFYQHRPFYSGRDLYLLIEKETMSKYVKFFIATVLMTEQYRFNYGRQANKSLPFLNLRLPIDKNGKPDWKWMEQYIKNLPYSDRI